MSGPQVSVLDAELAQLDDLGLLINDHDAAERVFRLIGALVALYEAHSFGAEGRCRRCRPVHWWRRRHACTVRDAFAKKWFQKYRRGVVTVRGCLLIMAGCVEAKITEVTAAGQ